ncbi:MAG TPA: hypothetical protein VFB81_19660 [Myxococcales bacterium]|nr:hypothetical protein [Myxococcales bacterium]
MSNSIRRETDWKSAPDLLDGPMQLDLTPEVCNIEYWLQHAVRGTLDGQVDGHLPGAAVPEYLLQPGPLRSAILEEFAFRTVSEEMGTRAITHLVRTAPTAATMEFYATQLLDEARHAAVFRRHLVDLGIAEGDVPRFIDETVGSKRDSVLVPLEKFALQTAGGQEDFIVGVLMLTVIVEGVLAPASEMSERKWRLLDPPAAQTARGANIDEVRHLCVGSAIIKDHLRRRPEELPRLLGLVGKGMELWKTVPIRDVIVQREVLFQQGIQAHAQLLKDYELVPGRKLLDTGVEERLKIQMEWSQAVQMTRMANMGLMPPKGTG